MNNTEKKVIILSAPSGAGKTTIVKELIRQLPNLEFSVSATTREKRKNEEHGKDYYFLTEEEFDKHIKEGDFVEYEEVYKGLRYGTLISEITRIWNNGHHVVFDVDVKGGMSLKRYFGDKALLLFIMPPSIEELERRLRARGTDNEETIQFRIAKARDELSYANKFDRQIVNEKLQKAIEETVDVVREFVKQ